MKKLTRDKVIEMIKEKPDVEGLTVLLSGGSVDEGVESLGQGLMRNMIIVDRETSHVRHNPIVYIESRDLILDGTSTDFMWTPTEELNTLIEDKGLEVVKVEDFEYTEPDEFHELENGDEQKFIKVAEATEAVVDKINHAIRRANILAVEGKDSDWQNVKAEVLTQFTGFLDSLDEYLKVE